MKKRTILIIFSLLLMIAPYLINIYSILRILSYILGIILFGIILFKSSKKIILNIIVIIALVLASYFIDYYLSNYKHIPIFSRQIKSSDKVKSYYSLIYKLDVCNKKYSVDKWYSNNYICDESDLNSISVNDFLSYYERNKKSYYKIEGKISKIVGESSIELSPYEYSEEAKNGEVTFKNDIVISVPINKSIDISNYKIYDEITIIGRVENIKNNKEIKTYNLTDVVIYPSSIYDEYEISYKEDNKCEYDKTLLAEAEDRNYYVSCLTDISVKFNNENVYDLDYVLLDKKITIDDLIKRSEKQAEFENGKVYEAKDIKFAVCNNSDVIFSTKFDDKLSYCDVLEDEGV